MAFDMCKPSGIFRVKEILTEVNSWFTFTQRRDPSLFRVSYTMVDDGTQQHHEHLLTRRQSSNP
jgi:hypothetical protein